MPTPQPGILDIEPYIGGEAQAPNAARVIRLASNEGALGASERAATAYSEAAAELHRYPDGGCVRLRAAIAERENLDAARIVCGAGSDELIALLVRAYVGNGDNIVQSEHAFLMYGINAKAVGAQTKVAAASNLGADVNALVDAVDTRTRIVFVANPNNPTGTVLNTQELARLRDAIPDEVLLVIDSAYAEYIDMAHYSAGGDLVERFDNVVMLRTFSKIYGLGGVRLGWSYCPESVASVLHRVRSPFNVSAPAQAAGIAALEDTEHLKRNQQSNASTLPWFRGRLNEMGLTTQQSYGNFVLPHFNPAQGLDADVARTYLKDRGILVRQMGAYGLDEYLRITIGTQEEMQLVADALSEWIEEQ